MTKTPIVFVHGYADRGESFGPWCRALEARGYQPAELNVCSYESLSNEVTIRDLGEAFERALLLQNDIGADGTFDAIVHSTGMLVVRSWLTSRDPKRLSRLKHLIALAPATFGSPLAHKGRSTLGSLFKGNRSIGPDFMEAGDLVLDGLELASRLQWDLTHEDVFSERVYYGDGSDTPWVFTFCGTDSYSGLRRIVNQPGTDGTVRWAGCSLNTRKITMDLTRRPTERRVSFDSWRHVAAPLVLVEDLNHSTIVSEPTEPLVDLVTGALQVGTHREYQSWTKAAEAASRPVIDRMARENRSFQQFVVRAVDERGDPVTDYHVEVFTRGNDQAKDRETIIEAFDADPHPYRGDRSLRCFHVNLSKVWTVRPKNLWLRVLVSSGSTLVGYHGHGSAAPAGDGVREIEKPSVDGDGSTELEIDLSEHLPDGPSTDRFFVPFTTTLVEIRFDREPYPLTGVSRLLKFLETSRELQTGSP